jgi:hypothetical protein
MHIRANRTERTATGVICLFVMPFSSRQEVLARGMEVSFIELREKLDVEAFDIDFKNSKSPSDACTVDLQNSTLSTTRP